MTKLSQRWRRGLLGTSLLSLFPVAYFIQPYLQDEYGTLCAFRTLTDLPCIFCGMTHALAHATHGHWNRAFQFHLLWWLGPLAMVSVSMLALFDATFGSDYLGALGRFTGSHSVTLTGALLVLTIMRAAFTVFSKG